MNLKEVGLRIAVLKVIADEVAASLSTAKEEARCGFTDTGATQTVPQLPDGTPVATVTLAGGGKKAARVANEAAFLAWMTEHHPEEIISVVRPNALRKILDEAQVRGRAVDDNGEPIPGITVGETSPYVSTRLKGGGKDAIIAAWRAGELTGIELVAPPALEAGAA